METDPNSTVNTSVQDLLKELKDRNEDLQSVKAEREHINQQIHHHREEMDRRMLLLLYMDEGLMDALRKLDAVKKEKQELDNKIQELTTRSTRRSEVSLSDLQKEEAALLEEENQLKLQQEKLKEDLENAQKILQEGPEPLEETDAVQTKTVPSGRKRSARK